MTRATHGQVLPAALLLSSVLFGVSCADTGDHEAQEVVLARYADGQVTLRDLDRQLRATSLSPEGPDAATDLTRLEDAVRRTAIDQIALQAARSDGTVESPEFIARQRDVRRRIATAALLQNEPELMNVSPQELQEFFETRREGLDQPERRRVQHIFKRLEPGRSRADVRRDLEALRSRALTGESFGLLAAEHSDSETRHQEGNLGLVVRGQFSSDFDSVVFQLDEGTPSEPVFTADGGHVFWVADVLPERRVQLSEVAFDLQRELLQERRDEALERLARQALENQPEVYLPEEYFQEQLALRRAPQVLFRVGSFEYRPGDFQRAGAEASAAKDPSTPAALLRRIYHQEVLLQYAADDENRPDSATPEEDAALVEVFLQREIRSMVADDAERLQAHYERNAARFAAPVRVSYSRLNLPKSPGASRVMAALETSVGALDEGSTTLDALAERYGGTVDRVERQTVAVVRSIDPAALRFVLSLPPGGHAPPYTSGERIFLVRLDERLDAETLPFETARAEVVRDLMETRLPELYAEFGEGLLSAADFRLDRRQLERGARLLAGLD